MTNVDSEMPVLPGYVRAPVWSKYLAPHFKALLLAPKLIGEPGLFLSPAHLKGREIIGRVEEEEMGGVGTRSETIARGNDGALNSALPEEEQYGTNEKYGIKHRRGIVLPSWAVPFRKHAAEFLPSPAGYQQTSAAGVVSHLGREEASSREGQKESASQPDATSPDQQSGAPSSISEVIPGPGRFRSLITQLSFDRNHLFHRRGNPLMTAFGHDELQTANSLPPPFRLQSSQSREESGLQGPRSFDFDFKRMPLEPWATDTPGYQVPPAAHSKTAGVPAYHGSFDEAPPFDFPDGETEQGGPGAAIPTKISLNRPLIETLMIQSNTAANAGDIRNRVEEVLLEIINSAISTI